MNTLIHKNDTVVILQGKDRGKKAKVLRVIPKDNAAIVEGMNLSKKHLRGRPGGKAGQIVSLEHPIPVHRLQLVCEKCGKASRTGSIVKGDTKTRVCRKCGFDI